MLFKFLGSGSAFNTALGNTSAFRKESGMLLLFDCGGTVFARVRQLDLLEGVQRVYVAVTHLHPDHIGSLGDLIFYCYYTANVELFVMYPQHEQLVKLLELQGVEKELYQTMGTDQYAYTLGGGLTVRPVLVSHVNSFHCYGYVVTAGSEESYYSGDSNRVPSDILDELHAGRFQYFYQDCCAEEYEGNVHLSMKRLCALVEQQARRWVWCMHLDEQFDTDEARRQGFHVVENYSLEVSYAHTKG